MTDFGDIVYFYPEKERAICKKRTFSIKEFRFCHLRKNIVCAQT